MYQALQTEFATVFQNTLVQLVTSQLISARPIHVKTVAYAHRQEMDTIVFACPNTLAPIVK